ncbi:MAG TPA: hypothetical protein VJO53_13060 [Candidatus Acidoferrales bacterium]|nr:hypothetical protein [Candidatus Acidoferrales bacterium]
MVEVVSLESVPLVERQHVREGVLRSRRLLTGTPGTPGNFSLQLSDTPTYYAPRHRHNFDQVRYQIEGDFDFAEYGVMTPGCVAYFPEGTYYGPQSCAAGSETLVLQFGGASGSGYISAEQYERATAELAKRGTFAKGVYTRLRPDGGKINQDAYEAVWEHVNGRPLAYPGERYRRPVFMDPETFCWVPIADEPGASGKFLGEFSERRTRISLYRVAAGARLRLEDHSIYFVGKGSGTVSEKPFERHATIHLGEGDRATLSATEPAELLQIGLPRIS